jgi:ribonuclease HI
MHIAEIPPHTETNLEKRKERSEKVRKWKAEFAAAMKDEELRQEVLGVLQRFNGIASRWTVCERGHAQFQKARRVVRRASAIWRSSLRSSHTVSLTGGPRAT